MMKIPMYRYMLLEGNNPTFIMSNRQNIARCNKSNIFYDLKSHINSIVKRDFIPAVELKVIQFFLQTESLQLILVL